MTQGQAEMRHRYASVLYLKEVKGMSKGTVRSTERSSNVSLLTCHTCVVDVDESRDFLSSYNKLSSDCALYLVPCSACLEQLLLEQILFS